MAKTDADIDALIARAYANDPTLTAKDVNTLLRASFMASPGNVLVVADFNAVEPRTLAWACGDELALNGFKNGTPYEDAAAGLWNISPTEVQKWQRNLGKAQIIGCGYGLGNPERLRDLASKPPYNVDWANTPLTPEEVIANYRAAHPAVVQFWRDMQRGAVAACDGYTTEVGPFVWGPSPLAPGRDVWMMLPSGRPVSYYRMRYTRGHRGPDIVYTGNKQGRVCDIHVYGGLFVENAVQAFDRELLALAMVRLEAEGYECVMSTHDEIVLDVPEPAAAEAERRLCEIMGEAPAWADGLPLKAESFRCRRYMK